MGAVLTFFATAVYALALLCFPQTGADAARAGLRLCGRVLLPALFPYLVLSHLLVGQGLGHRLGRVLSPVMSPLFHVSGAGGAALALGAVGGYPTGAAVVRSLLEQGAIDLPQAQTLLLFCNNSGPAFVLSVAGVSVFGSMRLGMILLAVHLASAVLTGILLRPKAASVPVTVPPSPRLHSETLLTDAVGKALSACLSISAFVVFFSVLTALLSALLPLSRLPAPGQAVVTGFLELSGGIVALTGQGTLTAMAVCAFLLGWGGCSVHCQTAALLAGSGLRMAPYLRAKLLHGLLSGGMVLMLSPVLSPLLSAGTEGGDYALETLFPTSIPVGWAVWAAAALVVGCAGGKRKV